MTIIEGHSVEGILNSISDGKSLELFRSVAKGSVESEVLKETKAISRKQFYTRTSQLLQAGLIKRSKGNFSLTSLGIIVYHAQLVIGAGVNNYWKLKAIDSIQTSREIVEQERLKLIKTILDDNIVQDILITQS